MCLLPQQRRLFHLSLSLSPSDSPLFFHFPSTPVVGHVTALTSSRGGRHPDGRRVGPVSAFNSRPVKTRLVCHSALALSQTLAVSPPPCCFPSLTLICFCLLYPCLLRRFRQLLLAQTSREKGAGDGLLNGSYFSAKVR